MNVIMQVPKIYDGERTVLVKTLLEIIDAQHQVINELKGNLFYKTQQDVSTLPPNITEDIFVLENVELHYSKLSRPEIPKSANKEPTWSIQIRTKSDAVQNEWKKKGLRPMPKIDYLDNAKYYSINVKKSALNSDGSDAEPVIVLDHNLDPLDSLTIGNRSIGNVQLSFHGPNKKVKLMAVQVTKLLIYVKKKDFSVESLFIPTQQLLD